MLCTVPRDVDSYTFGQGGLGDYLLDSGGELADVLLRWSNVDVDHPAQLIVVDLGRRLHRADLRYRVQAGGLARLAARIGMALRSFRALTPSSGYCTVSR